MTFLREQWETAVIIYRHKSRADERPPLLPEMHIPAFLVLKNTAMTYFNVIALNKAAEHLIGQPKILLTERMFARLHITLRGAKRSVGFYMKLSNQLPEHNDEVADERECDQPYIIWRSEMGELEPTYVNNVEELEGL